MAWSCGTSIWRGKLTSVAKFLSFPLSWSSLIPWESSNGPPSRTLDRESPDDKSLRNLCFVGMPPPSPTEDNWDPLALSSSLGSTVHWNLLDDQGRHLVLNEGVARIQRRHAPIQECIKDGPTMVLKEFYEKTRWMRLSSSWTRDRQIILVPTAPCR